MTNLAIGSRAYVNLTNSCNTECAFCCMNSSPNKNDFMTFQTFQSIIDKHGSKPLELQLEGGEPLLHPNLYLFLEYAIYKGNLNKITIATNGILLKKHLQRLIAVSENYGIKIVIKHSINYHLLEQDSKLISKCRDLYLAVEFLENLKIQFNVRLRHNDEWIISLLKEGKIFEQSSVYFLQNYGKLQDETYDKPVIVHNIEDWSLYSWDGTCFGQNLISRSEHEGAK